MTTEPGAPTQKMCELCHEKPVALNGYVCDDCYMKATYQPTVELILLHADGKVDHGIVVMTPLGMENSDHNELAGHWSMTPDGNTWVTLVKTTEALMDRATLVCAEITERRLRGIPLMGPVKAQRRSTGGASRKPRAAKEPAEEVSPQADTIEAMQALRARLRPQA